MRRLLALAILVAVGCNAKQDHAPPPAAPRAPGVPATPVAPAAPAAGTDDPVVTRLEHALTTAFPGITLRLTPDDVLHVVTGSSSGSDGIEITMDNIRRSCASSETECADAIDSVVQTTKKSSLFAAKSDEPEALPDRKLIRLTPKPTEWLAAADTGAAKMPEHAEENRLVRQKFAGDLWWVYVVDEPRGMRIINNKLMKQLGMTIEQLHALAVANLAGQYPKLQFTELTPGLWTIEPGDYLDSARLALTDQWRAEAKKRGGTLIASVPARSRVFVSNDPKLRAGFDKITAKAFAEEDHPLSQVVLVWTDKGWKPEH
jgi:hypothetical protein